MSLLVLLREQGVCTAAGRTSSSLFHLAQPSISPFSLSLNFHLTFFIRPSTSSRLFHSAPTSISPCLLGPKLQLSIFTWPSPPSCLFHLASTSISPSSHSWPALSELIHSAFSPFSLSPTLHHIFSTRPKTPSHLFHLAQNSLFTQLRHLRFSAFFTFFTQPKSLYD